MSQTLSSSASGFAALPDSIACQWPSDAPALHEALRTVFPDPSFATGPSHLTRSERPVEYAFVWPGGVPRFTADPLPGGNSARRVGRALECTGIAPDDRMSEVLRWQTAGSHWGAWVGARCRHGRPSYKLYLEVPGQAPWQAFEREHFSTNGEGYPGGAEMCMVGFDPEGGSVEAYYRLNRLYPDEISALLRRASLPEFRSEVLNMLRALTGASFARSLPTANLGFSYSHSEAGVEAFTLYSFASSLLGPDVDIRRAVLRFADANGWDATAYERVTEALESTPYGWSAHGMIGFVADRRGGIHFTVGISPAGAA